MISEHPATPDSGRTRVRPCLCPVTETPHPSHKMDDEERAMQHFVRSTMMAMLQPVAEHVRDVQEQVDKRGKELTAVHARCDENKARLDQYQEDFGTLRTGVGKVESNVDKLQNDLANVYREKERLHNDHETTKGDAVKVANSLKKSNSELKALQGKFEELEAEVVMLHQSSAKAKQLQEQVEFTTQLREFTEGLNSRHMELVQDVGNLAKAHGTTKSALSKFIHSYEQADSGLQSELQRLRDHLDSLEGRLGGTQQQLIESMEADLDCREAWRRLERQANMFQADQQKLRASQNDTINRQEVQGIALAKTQADLQNATKEIHSASKQIHVLKDGLAETNLSMTKLGSRYDSCTKNIMGMTKGLHDISKSVGQGEHGLLRPKSATARRLPGINCAPPFRMSRDPSPVRSLLAEETRWMSGHTPEPLLATRPTNV